MRRCRLLIGYLPNLVGSALPEGKSAAVAATRNTQTGSYCRNSAKGVFVCLMRAMDGESDCRERRLTMVQRQIADRGVRDPLVLAALRDVPRENFLPADLRELAYDDAPLPIGQGQTISQPYIVALMAESLLLRGGERVLEVGTGSGYAAAVIAQIAAEVYTVERYEELATRAAGVLAAQGYTNVHVLHADGTLGLPEHAPFDAIAVAAGGPEVPKSLKTQLKIGGRLVIPIGRDRYLQELLRITRTSGEEFRTEELADVRFVPLVGESGWDLP